MTTGRTAAAVQAEAAAVLRRLGAAVAAGELKASARFADGLDLAAGVLDGMGSRPVPSGSSSGPHTGPALQP